MQQDMNSVLHGKITPFKAQSRATEVACCGKQSSRLNFIQSA